MPTERWTSVFARLGMPTGDGRILAPGGITSRDLPMPLMWQEKTADGHEGSFTVGAIDSIEIHEDMITASGYLLDLFPDKERVIELITAGVVGPSVDLDQFSYVMDDEGTILVTEGRVSGATLVPIEAFAEVSITMAQMSAETEPAAAMVLVASAVPDLPSLSLFHNPGLTELTPLTIEGDHVFGHIAPWGVCHVGLPGCVTAPMSNAEYAYFLTGAEKTAEGVVVPVGKLTVGGGHADPSFGYRAAAEHYDDACNAVASVFAGEDEFGIWVSGYVLPGATHEAVSALQRSPISGDWRSIGGNMELIAAHAVNVPGFPVPRVKASFASGAQISLIGHFGMQPGKMAASPADAAALANRKKEALAARARWAWKMRQKGRS